MVSLWPWKGDTTSAASFEKTLSALSSKISKANLRGDRLTFRARRLKALWTLYTIFGYILGCLILFLVTGRDNWRPVEYGVVVASPFVIYAVRAAIAAYYKQRVATNQAYVDDLNQQKENAIQKLKEATKYNSTQELLDKYGAASRESQLVTPSNNKRQSISGSATKQPSRTNLPPPPTANIPRPDIVSPSSPVSLGRFSHFEGSQAQYGSLPATPRSPLGNVPFSPSADAEFAPNAFSTSSEYATASQGQSRWYDRLMDVLLGDDETRAGNRLALICTHCKLVNGQAPPGTKRLEDVGRWRCSNCKEWNGQARDVHEVLIQAANDEKRHSSALTNEGRSSGISPLNDGSSMRSRHEIDREQDDDSNSAHHQLMREAKNSSAAASSDPSESENEGDEVKAKSARNAIKRNK